MVEDTVPRLHSKGLNIIIQVMAKEIRKGLFFISQWAYRTEKELTEINISRQERVTSDRMLCNKISKTLFVGVPEFCWCTEGFTTSEGSKSLPEEEGINTRSRIQGRLIKGTIN